MLALYPPMPKAKRAPGRPAIGTKLDHVRCLWKRAVLGLPLETIAFDERVSLATVKRWVALARTYPEGADAESIEAALLAG